MDEQISEIEFTLHSILRWIQRTRKRYRHIDECSFVHPKQQCEKCAELKKLSYTEYCESRKQIEQEITDRFWKSKQITHVRDSFLPERVNSRHFMHGSMVFVVDFSSAPPRVLTCFDMRSHREVIRLLNKERFSGNRKKR